MRRVALALALGAPMAAACDAAERGEARAVASAVARFRAADHASTPAAVEALRATPCTTKAACDVRDACLASGEATSEALQLKAEVERALSALERGALASDSPEARALPAKLDRAAERLDEGHGALEDCDTKAQALKRKHRL